jgi:uncharacterized membrane protein
MFGHPLHPALVHFPIGLLLSATIADLAWLAGLIGDPHIAAVLMAAGLAAAIAAMAAGAVDFARLEESVVPHALRHVGVVAVAWIGYGIALYLRRESLAGTVPAGTASLALSFASAALLSLGGWLGGRLVYTFGAGVSKPTL